MTSSFHYIKHAPTKVCYNHSDRTVGGARARWTKKATLTFIIVVFLYSAASACVNITRNLSLPIKTNPEHDISSCEQGLLSEPHGKIPSLFSEIFSHHFKLFNSSPLSPFLPPPLLSFALSFSPLFASSPSATRDDYGTNDGGQAGGRPASGSATPVLESDGGARICFTQPQECRRRERETSAWISCLPANGDEQICSPRPRSDHGVRICHPQPREQATDLAPPALRSDHSHGDEVMDSSTNPSPLMWFDNTTHNLLRAADCYGLERLKAICETKLCLDIDVKSVMVILLLADQHQCDMLKQACFSFIANPNTLETVIGTPEYHQFKSLYPILLIEVLENVCILRK
uniref:BPM/SPOP BACK domain-containing protein n=1 Tax=Oryza meridionalis TaxID=40149 RepID=A0A0E0EJA9_9ORYZ